MLQAAKQTDVTWAEIALADAAPVSAAKLHVLQLGPIKERIGDRWPKLSELVHKLFEKALRRCQGPRDHFVLVAEGSYVATFHGLSPEEANLACTAVAKEVCEMLFGQDTENVSVRSLVGAVPGPLSGISAADATRIATTLEKTGKEIIVTRRATAPAEAEPDWLIQAHTLAARLRHPIGFYPAWELSRRKSQLLFLGMETREPQARGPAGIAETLGPCPAIREMEIAALRAAAAYRARVERSGQICAINAGVSCETLCCVQSRTAYLNALKASRLSPACPLFITIEQVPPGMPVGRLCDLAGLLASPSVRVLLEFEQIRAIPHLNIRLKVTGIGATLPERCPSEEARKLIGLLLDRAREQRACSYLHGLETPALVAMAGAAGLKFGAGLGFGRSQPLTGLEDLPALPLSLEPSRQVN